jgi:hypothetical protein
MATVRRDTSGAARDGPEPAVTSAPDIPQPESVTAAWLTERLREAGFARAAVRSLRSEAVGTGQTGKCVRYELELVQPGTAPSSLIGKFPSDDPLSRDSAVAMGIYEREVVFYRDLAPRLEISVPRCFHAAIDDQGRDFVILMEDLAPARPGDQLAGCSAEVARAAVLELVGLQAPTWCDAAMADRFAEPADGFFSDMHGLYNRMLPAFMARFEPGLADDEAGLIRRLGASPQAPLFQELGTPYCLEHRDYRLDNLLIDETVSPPRVTVVDWQGLRVGRPLNDVALCIAGGLDPAIRRAVEADILRDYHGALVAAGVGGFDWARCWREYRRAAFAGLGLTVIASVAVAQTPRGDAMFTAMARRYARHALDVGADEFLS